MKRAAIRSCLIRCAIALTAVVPVSAGTAADISLIRISGAVTVDNYPKLEAYLNAASDTIVGLKIMLDAQDQYADGVLMAYEDGGAFLTYVPGPDMETEFSVNGGYSLQHGAYVLDGFYLVKDAGFNQGISAVALEQVPESQVILSGAKVQDVEVDALDPSMAKR
ncbi:hypothetical protein [Roseibium suaedae]|uniref:Uncharacterized protein n=1 Tax=Roseibium suaedae TaxID=735517 RepID=A0A1M7MMV4_9HYPH|nr:hypothetical protein [Roseibium suaedae]SHM92323.1 hypothetical protein SAMN05444272_3478 [Roseibium suaedae]